ncbi:MAG TPA: tetratricopeptide repeat protein [Paracoccaceae bacterium]|nr:tetratricopeptide repeat protein [Paracoccaceae bacterium]
MRVRLKLALFAIAATSFLSACDTAEERAEERFKSGMEYLQAGDVDRALVEFRNVFKLNGEHREARLAYAEAERGRGNLREAYSQYLRLIEQYPNDPVGLKALAELSVDNGQWDDAERYVTAALKISPDDLSLQATQLLTLYGRAVEQVDAARIVEIVTKAQALKAELPDSLTLYKIIIDDLIRSQSLDKALSELNAAIKIAPSEKILYAQRLSVNAAMGDDAAVEAGLIEMVKVFPDAPEMPEALLRWYLAQKDLDKAEAYLRSRVDPAADDTTPRVALVQFLGQYRGPEAALKELDAAIEAGKNVSIFRSARAGFHFDQGDRDSAIAEMEAILTDVPDAEEARMIKVALARMQLANGNSVAARALVEEVLAEDSGNVEATKLKATWLILGDEAPDAVTLLRDAIDQNPRDAALMTLMAQAYEREGNRDLMRDMLAQAVQASGRAPEESLRYAQLLAAEDKLLLAEGALIDALRLTPGNPTLLVPLGQLYVQLQDWPRADTVARDLESLQDPTLVNDIAAIRAAILNGQQKTDDALSYLQTLASGEGAQLDAKIAVLRNHMENGRIAEALAYSALLAEQNPDNLDLKYIHAAVQATAGDQVAAEAGYRGVLEKDPARAAVWMALFRSVYSDPARRAEAAEIVDQAIQAVPESGELRWAKAGLLEASGDIDGAIAVYEALYTENSANPIVANNLSSLLSNYRSDPDSLKRAEVIARRLRGSNIPPYQDTYGWIAYLNGDFTSAVAELKKAAEGLPQDPMVRYHFGMALAATGQTEEAIKQFESALALIPAGDSRDFANSARTELEKLKAAAGAPKSP